MIPPDRFSERSTKVKDSVEGLMVKPRWSAIILGRILTDAPVSHIEWGNSTPLTTHGIANFPGSLFFDNVLLLPLSISKVYIVCDPLLLGSMRKR
ncbi:hypothetical protein IGI04_042961 [Brassica rapa subsp. trilocularis]|uniref:Uncharacterized protein n=1 Tax=Brassica rapa subsp. trilocularis TaxID=1813537 RepID=A0ABQ7KKN6_BRACM|nr:hypothetical protein IGI04_042961 [Brassica rapa subsp. trilocularis]